MFPRIHGVSGTAVLTGNPYHKAPLQLYRLRDGRFSAPTSVGPALSAWPSVTAPTKNDLLIGSYFFYVGKRAFRPAPSANYQSFSTNGHYLLAWEQTPNAHLYHVVHRADTGQAVWREAGAYFPVWDRSGTQLVYASVHSRAGKREVYATFDPAYYRLTETERRARMTLFAVSFGRGISPRPRKIREAEAKSLVGDWYGAFLALCLRHDCLAVPRKGQILPAPNGGTVLVYLSWLAQSAFQHRAADGTLLPPRADGSNEQVLYQILIDKNGMVRKKMFPEVAGVCWSANGQYVYGTLWLSDFDADDDAYPRHFARLEVSSGKVETVLLPKPMQRVLTFVDD